MIPRVISIIDQLLGAAAAEDKVVVPRVLEMDVGEGGDVIPMQGDSAGLVVDRFDEFPSPLGLTFRGKVVVGKLVPHPPAMNALQVSIGFSRTENPALSVPISVSTQPEADGSFSTHVTLRFDSNKPVPVQLRGAATIKGSSVPVKDMPIVVENANLEWFLGLVDQWEKAMPAPSPAHIKEWGLANPRVNWNPRGLFLARMRKALLQSSEFNQPLGRYAQVPPLHERFSHWAERLGKAKGGYHVRFKGKAITMSHVLVGIEGGRLQDPQPSVAFSMLPGARPDLLVTWAGDLGGALADYLVDTYYLEDPQAKTLDGYLQENANLADLVGDIDGVNLSFEYVSALSLADNLRAYYGTTSQKRFSRFLEVTEIKPSQPALFLKPGGGSPRLTEVSKQFIAQEIFRVAWAITAKRTVFRKDIPKEKRVRMPPVVEAALKVSSSEIQKLTDIFVDFLEQGLAAERTP